MSYKISLKINMFLKYFYIKYVLRKYKYIIKHCAFCIITTPSDNKIRYLDIYLKHLISIEDFFKICMDLDHIRYDIFSNIKLKEVKNNIFLYSLMKEYKKVDKIGKILRRYDKINI